MAEGVNDRALKHSGDGAWARCFVSVFEDGAVLDGTCGESLLVHGYGVVREEFDSHGCETC